MSNETSSPSPRRYRKTRRPSCSTDPHKYSQNAPFSTVRFATSGGRNRRISSTKLLRCNVPARSNRILSSSKAHGEIETEHPGYLGSQDTFYVGTLKGVGRVYQQTCVDTYCKVAHAKLYTSKTPITAADLLNERVLPFYEEHELPVLRILTDRGTEYCGKPEHHDYQLYLALNDIEHTRTKARSPQTNGIVVRFHRTILNEFYQVTFRKRIYSSIEQLQSDLDDWLEKFNTKRTHQGKMCCGRTPLETLIDGKKIWQKKKVA